MADVGVTIELLEDDDEDVVGAVGPPFVSSVPLASPQPQPRPDSLDAQAQALIGACFLDDEFGWCTVTSWGTDYGCHLLFYRPTVSLSNVDSEEFSSLPEVVSWIDASPSVPDSVASLAVSIGSAPVLLLFGSVTSLGVPVKSLAAVRGSVSAYSRTLPVLKDRTLRKILSAKESIF